MKNHLEWLVSDDGVSKTDRFIERVCSLLLGITCIGITVLIIYNLMIGIGNG